MVKLLAQQQWEKNLLILDIELRGKLSANKNQEILGKINGAVGNFNAHISHTQKKIGKSFLKNLLLQLV